jgi:hypothetical protein
MATTNVPGGTLNEVPITSAAILVDARNAAKSTMAQIDSMIKSMWGSGSAVWYRDVDGRWRPRQFMYVTSNATVKLNTGFEQPPNISVSKNGSTVSWTGSDFSHVIINWPTAKGTQSARVQYGTFSYVIPNLVKGNTSTVTITPYLINTAGITRSLNIYINPDIVQGMPDNYLWALLPYELLFHSKTHPNNSRLPSWGPFVQNDMSQMPYISWIDNRMSAVFYKDDTMYSDVPQTFDMRNGFTHVVLMNMRQSYRMYIGDFVDFHMFNITGNGWSYDMTNYQDSGLRSSLYYNSNNTSTYDVGVAGWGVYVYRYKPGAHDSYVLDLRSRGEALVYSMNDLRHVSLPNPPSFSSSVTSTRQSLFEGNGSWAYNSIAIGGAFLFDRAVTDSELLQVVNFLLSNNTMMKKPPIDHLSDPGQAAARALFSTRRLREAFSGPCLTVRRGSDNQTGNFYSDVDGSLFLDVIGGTTLEAWLGNATGYVSKWWDQSGKGNHAIQSIIAAQPIIRRYPIGTIWSPYPHIHLKTPVGLPNTNYNIKRMNPSYTGPVIRVQRSDNQIGDFYPNDAVPNKLATSTGTDLSVWLNGMPGNIIMYFDQGPYERRILLDCRGETIVEGSTLLYLYPFADPASLRRRAALSAFRYWVRLNHEGYFPAYISAMQSRYEYVRTVSDNYFYIPYPNYGVVTGSAVAHNISGQSISYTTFGDNGVIYYDFVNNLILSNDIAFSPQRISPNTPDVVEGGGDSMNTYHLDFYPNRFMTLPNGTVPAGNSEYTLVAKHGNVPGNHRHLPILSSGTNSKIKPLFNGLTVTVYDMPNIYDVANNISTPKLSYLNDLGCKLIGTSTLDRFNSINMNDWVVTGNIKSVAVTYDRKYVSIYTKGKMVQRVPYANRIGNISNTAIGRDYRSLFIGEKDRFFNGKLYSLCIFGDTLIDEDRDLVETM